MSRGVVSLVTVGVAVLCVAACQRRQENQYFPLDAGRTWTYRVTEEADGEAGEPRTMAVTSVGAEEMAGQKVARQKIEVDDATHFLFVGVDEKGVFRFATQSDGEDQPKIDVSRDYFVAYPVEVGKSWPGKTAPTFLDRLELNDVMVDIKSTIESTSETVTVAAGEFADCVKVRMTGSVRLGPDAADEDDVGVFSLDEQTWFAKDVGVVKSVVEEAYKEGSDHERVRVTNELQSFTR